jgi:acetyl-CoA synthetase
MLDKFVTGTQFESYEDYYANLDILVPDNFNFAYDVVDEWARTDPDKLALVWVDEQGNSASFTFGDLKRESDRTAAFFQSLGLGKGDPVMLILKRRYQFWFCVLALHKLGAIAIPTTHLVTAKDIVYRNNAAGVKMIVAAHDDRLLEAIEASGIASPSLVAKAVISGPREGWLDFDAEIARAGDFVRPEGDASVTNEDIMLLYFTSGMTGLPKMVVHNFTYPLGHILTAAFWQQARDGGLHLTVADTGWAKAAWGKIYGQWVCGASVFAYDYDRFEAASMMHVVADHGVTSFCAPPTIYRFIIRLDLSHFDLSKVEHWTVAGEPLNPQVFEEFLRQTGKEIKEGYGQTETVVAVATWPWLRPKPGSMGKPSPGYEISLVKDDGQPCAIGEEGHLVLSTSGKLPPGMFVGYYRDPELTASVWHGGVYDTGDIASCDEDGYLWFVGRADDMIKSSGYRIGPFEVESALVEHPAVLECAITGVPDAIRGQVVKATVVLCSGHEPCEDLMRELQDHVKQVTAAYKYPRIIEFVTELPKTISGKIRRVEIREGDAD